MKMPASKLTVAFIAAALFGATSAQAKLGIVSVDANAVSPVAIGDSPQLLATPLSQKLEYTAYGVNLPTTECAVDLALEYATVPASGKSDHVSDPNLRIYSCGVSRITTPQKLRAMIISDKSFRLLVGRDVLTIVERGFAPGVPEHLLRVQLEDGSIASLDELGSMDISAGKMVGVLGQPLEILSAMTTGTRGIILDRQKVIANDRLTDLCAAEARLNTQGILFSVDDLSKLELDEIRAIKRIRIHGQRNQRFFRSVKVGVEKLESPKIGGYAVTLRLACSGNRDNKIWIPLELIADLGPRSQRALLSALVSIRQKVPPTFW